MKIALPAAAFLLAPLGLAALALAPTGGRDLTRLPADPAQVEGRLAACTVPLSQALAAAEQAGGRVRSLALNAEGAEQWTFECYRDGRERRVVIDAKTGELLATEEVPPFALPGDPVSGKPVKTSSGLAWYDLRPGTGEMPAGPAAKIRAHYTGWLVDGTKFDSSVDRGTPLEFQLYRMVPGWVEGLSSMRVGGKRKLLVPGKLGYGERGFPPRIPPHAFLIFDVELVAIVE